MQKAFFQKDELTLLRLSIVPGSSRDQICGYLGDRLKIKIIATAQNGKANQYLLKFLLIVFEVNINSLSLIGGETSKNKDILINLKIDEVIERLSID